MEIENTTNPFQTKFDALAGRVGLAPALAKKIVIAFVLIIAVLLLWPSSHGYEGVYKFETSSAKSNSKDFMSGFTDMAMKMSGADKIEFVIGSDYIESQGSRTEADIFTRKSGSNTYLVAKYEDGSEETFKIKGKGTLEEPNSGLTLKLIRNL